MWNWTAVPLEMDDLVDTVAQRETLKLLRTGMTQIQAAKERGCHRSKISDMVIRLKKTCRAHGYDPESGLTRITPPPHFVKSRSELVKIDEHGNEVVTMYWNKTDTLKQSESSFRETVDELCKGIVPFKYVKPPKQSNSDLCVEYGITDFHLGQYSWKPETGAAWDMEIAEKVFLESIAEMMAGSPDAEQAIFLQLGDFLDWDGQIAVTPMSKNIMDADTRYPKLVQVAIQCCVKAVEMMLYKHKMVHVVCAEGNHDMSSSVWLRAIMASIFRSNDRVTIEKSPFPFYSFRFGSTFLGYHHGHLVKMESMASKFFSEPQFRAEMGDAKHIYLKCGHLHKQQRMEVSGAIIERLPTLNARGAYGARGFDHTERAAHAITYHRYSGEISRKTVYPKGE